MSDFDDLTDEFRTSSQLIDAADKQLRSADEINKARLGSDRSWIAKIIMGTYGAVILGVLLYLLFWAPDCNSKECKPAIDIWNQQSEYILNLIVTAVVPIVTLMLGFYFGSEKSSSGQNPNN